MPAATFPDYAQVIAQTLHQAVATGVAGLLALRVDHRSAIRSFIAGSLQFTDGSTLHFREFIELSQTEPKIMYAYPYQDADHNLIFRCDHAAHRPALPYPTHRHTPSGVEASPLPTLSEILDRILRQANL